LPETSLLAEDLEDRFDIFVAMIDSFAGRDFREERRYKERPNDVNVVPIVVEAFTLSIE
jgi:hypothetical protein